MKLFGISNCDTVRKARKYLAAHACEVEFIDFRKTPLNPDIIQQWLTHSDWPTLVNKRSTSWRALDETQKELLNSTTPSAEAIALLITEPTLIKRPVLQTEQGILFGFDPVQYQQHI
ncbi:arsenate reductase [Thiosulfatimonas sediminis]|uniref:Arsenate reductase n=1 Tax=Thiosulfatimonas sediminis TaxID=2675054 RepID=A0A6F8PV26_9GAMM|nr:arsenate reductase [Thiosulfatimonas sediminis]BBP45887.1 arsenate reductase [Thiosulfatimonas sediminis]